jgi:nicotinamide-nucleotide amidase
MTHTIAILTIGSEILDGRIVDTNSSFLGRTARSRGLAVTTRVTCDDDQDIIVRWIRELLCSVDILVMTGGLGPTPDDLTRDAIAAFAGKELTLVDEELEKLKEWYESKGRELTAINSRQAFFPKGALCIHNPVGTASGIWLEVEVAGRKKAIVALPGIPRELEPMWREDVLDRMGRFLGVEEASNERIIRTFGLPESEVAQRLLTVAGLHKLQIAYQVMYPEVIVVMRGSRGDDNLFSAAIEAIGAEYIVSQDYGTPLPKAVADLLRAQQKTVSVAESCTGGLIGQLITIHPGASSVFPGGIVAYSNKCKESLLGVDGNLFERDGAVSGAVVRSMARGVRARTHSSVAVSISGIAGPDGATPTKPVGTFFVGLSTGNATKSYRFFFSSDRDRIRIFAAYKALDVVRRELSGLPAPDDARELEEEPPELAGALLQGAELEKFE